MPTDNSQSREDHVVLFVTNTLGYGGSEKHLIELVARLDNSSVRSIILCAHADPFTERLNGNRGVNIAVRREIGLKSAADWFRLFKEIRPDVVVFVYGTLLDIPWYVSAAGWLAGIRKMYSIQHLIAPPLPPTGEGKSPRAILRRLIGKRMRQRLTARVPPRLYETTICVSDAVRDSLVQGYGFPRHKMLTIRNGVSLSEFTPTTSGRSVVRDNLGIRPEDFVLVCTARLSQEKGIDILLLAMRQLLDKNLPCTCIVVGEGFLKEALSQQIKALNLSQYVFLEGFHEDVRPYLAAGDALVLSSYKEGLPFAILEAMACGLPCIVTNVGGNAEAVANNVTGLVVNAGSADEIATAVSYLLEHPKEREQMSEQARLRAVREFDIEVRMADIKRVILSSFNERHTNPVAGNSTK